MQQVGLHLQQKAVNLGEQNGGEPFARSSFNRYYYSVFLEVRELLASTDAKWATLPHKSYPELLRGQLKKRINRIREIARRGDDIVLSNDCKRANSFVLNLATLMERAYALRVIADYNPDVPIEFKGADRFKLSDTEISEAHEWQNRVKIWVNSIREVLIQADA